MRRIGHWTPRYIFNRARNWAYEKRNMDKPWITSEANSLLSTLLLPTDRGVEWGSGRSTKWFAGKIRHLTSIEDNADWHAIVTKQLADAGTQNVDYFYRPIDRATNPADSEYVRACAAFTDESLGFALVDGELRDQCALTVLAKISPGGLLVIDNAHWFLDHATHSPASRYGKGPLNETWAAVQSQLRGWRMIWTSNGVSDTAIWVKPQVGKPDSSS